jgi:hypothetical protein
MADHAREREPADDRIGHPRLRSPPDVSGNPVQLVERSAPAARIGATPLIKKAVHVEKDRLCSFDQIPPVQMRDRSSLGSCPCGRARAPSSR